MRAIVTTIVIVAVSMSSASTAELEWIRVTDDGKSFVLEPSGQTFVPWGFNYDHDRRGRLLEEYWDAEWSTVEEDFAEMKRLGANTVRIHLQFSAFMQAPNRPNPHAFDQLDRLLDLAERTGLYLDLTGLGCYHKSDVSEWYDELDEADRWLAQAEFWRAVASRCADRPAVFCYDLMNEPVVPGGTKRRDDWLGPAFAGKYFVQFIALETKDRPRHEIARQWIEQLVAAIREHDRRHLITVGMVPWSVERPGMTSGFNPARVADQLNFIAMHIYPEQGKRDEALSTLKLFDVGKPVVIEEIFPLKCSATELAPFFDASVPHAAGWIGFYWGKTPDEYRGSDDIRDAITLSWLELFQEKREQMTPRGSE